ncbi:hypothetical protein KR018_003793 [Drosophila ironensis]|nr:hypothetical protein KR018_003793 [Drosophila ironensis]
MAIKRRIHRPGLLFLFFCLFLKLELGQTASVPSDGRLVFPRESASNGNATEKATKLESRLREINLELQEITRQTSVDKYHYAPMEIGKGAARSTENENPSTKPGNANESTINATTSIGNSTDQIIDGKNNTHLSSETKMITFRNDSESDIKPLWSQMEVTTPSQPKPSVVIGPRITLETDRVCPEGTIRSGKHCRKIA